MNSQTHTLPPPKDGHTHNVLAYLRVSRAEASTGGHTLETQELRIRQKLDQMLGHGHYRLKILQDDGVSGAYGFRSTRKQKQTRAGLTACTTELDTGAYDLFAVYHTSRLARSLRVFLEFVEEHLDPNNVRFVSVTEETDLSTPMGRTVANMAAGFNQMVREGIIARNKDAALMRAEAGYYLGHIPYAWQWEPQEQVAPGARRRILPIAERGEWVVRMKEWYLAGWSLHKIVGKLNELGVPPPCAYNPASVLCHGDKPLSGKWSTTVLWNTLSNPLHAGLVPSAKGPIQGEHYPHRYFDPQVRERILAAKDDRKKFPTNTASQHNERLLNGLVRCARCGKRLYPTTHSGGKYRVYRCLSGLSVGASTCPGVGVREDELDAAVIELVGKVAHEPPMRTLLIQEADKAADAQDAQLLQERTQLSAQVAELGERFSRLMGALSRGLIRDEEFAYAGEQLRGERAQQEGRLAEVEAALSQHAQRHEQAARVRELVLDFAQVWQHLDFSERREVLCQLIEELTVDTKERDHRGKCAGRSESVVRVKVALLPEQVLALVHEKVKRKEKPTTGLAGLSKRHLSLLYWIGQGKSRDEAAEAMAITRSTVNIFAQQIKARLGVRDLQEAARLAKGRVQAEKSTLPLGGLQGPQAQAEGGIYLSPSLMEVLPLYASGAKTKEIAQMLALPITTVLGRHYRILQTLHVDTMYQAVQKARAAGLL